MRLSNITSQNILNEESSDEITADFKLSFDVSFKSDPVAQQLMQSILENPALLSHLEKVIASGVRQGIAHCARHAQTSVDLGDRWIDDVQATGYIAPL